MRTLARDRTQRAGQLVAGMGAPGSREQAGGEAARPARRVGSRKYPPIEPAPGRYVNAES